MLLIDRGIPLPNCHDKWKQKSVTPPRLASVDADTRAIFDNWHSRAVDCQVMDHAVSLSAVLQRGTLPAATRNLSSSPSCFCSRVKTELFTRAYGFNSPWHVRNRLAIRMDFGLPPRTICACLPSDCLLLDVVLSLSLALVFGTLFLPTSLQHLLCSLSENV